MNKDEFFKKLGITGGDWSISADEDEYRIENNAKGFICQHAETSLKANAHLISCAPDMLIALIKSALTYEKYAEIHTNKRTEEGMKKALKNKEMSVYQATVIEKATGKTWEEVKELAGRLK